MGSWERETCQALDPNPSARGKEEVVLGPQHLNLVHRVSSDLGTDPKLLLWSVGPKS